MKRTFTAVVITFLCTSALWYVGLGLRRAYEICWLWEAVQAPGWSALETIHDDLQAGNYELAKARLEVFRASWRRFNAERGPGGNGIGNIMDEFQDMPMPSTSAGAADQSLQGER